MDNMLILPVSLAHITWHTLQIQIVKFINNDDIYESKYQADPPGLIFRPLVHAFLG